VGNGGEEIPVQQNPVEVEEKRLDGHQRETSPVELPATDEITAEMARRFLAEP
jgi:hypothetical protein